MQNALASLFTLSASLTYAGSGCGGCGGGTKDGDKKGEKTGFIQSATLVAGSGCGGGTCDGDKKDGKGEKSGYALNIEYVA